MVPQAEGSRLIGQWLRQSDRSSCLLLFWKLLVAAGMCIFEPTHEIIHCLSGRFKRF